MRKQLKFSQYIVDPNQFRFRNVIRIVALVMLLINKLKSTTNSTSKSHIMGQQSCKAVLQNLPFDFKITEYLVTSERNHTINPTGNEIKCRQGLVIILTDVELGEALNYYFTKAMVGIKELVNKNHMKVYLKRFLVYYIILALNIDLLNKDILTRPSCAFSFLNLFCISFSFCLQCFSVS